MLSRALLPLSRPKAIAPAVKIAFCSTHRRYYAKDRKAKTTSNLKSPAHTPSSPWQNSASKNPVVDNAPPSTQPRAAPADNSGKGLPEFETYTKPSEANLSPTEKPLSNNRIPGKDDSSDVTPEEEALQEELAKGNNGVRRPLPDLTQGIPSTLDEELKQVRSRVKEAPASLNITEDPAEPTPSSGGRGGDGLPKNAYISSNERKKNALIKYTYLATFSALFGWTLYLGRNWESDEEERRHPDAPSGWGFGLFYGRVKARMASTLNYYNEPAFPKLLPDEEADPALRAPFTLVLSLEDLLVHQEWSRESGWRIAKRPGVDYFIRYLSQYYELVLFTSQPYYIGESVLRKLDPYRIIRWPLFREATFYSKGEYIKDLSYLNRDLSKVILIDTVPSHAKHQPANSIILPKWTGDPGDQTLVQLIPFLEYVATMGFEDTRKVLQSFEGTYIPAEFAKREKVLREKFAARLAEDRKKKAKRSVAAIGSFIGVKNPPAGPDGIDPAALDEGEMLWDQIRKQGQKRYELLDKQIREEGQKWLEDMAAEEKQLQDESMNSVRGSVMGFFGLPAGGGGGGGEKN